MLDEALQPAAPGEPGDLARVGEDGEIVRVGRDDTQIKSRGYRLGLEESAVVAVESAGIDELAIACGSAPRAGVTLSPAREAGTTPAVR